MRPNHVVTLFVLCAASACASRRDGTASPPPAPRAAADAALAMTPDAASTAAPDTTPEAIASARLPGATVRLAVPWPGAGGFDDALGVVGMLPTRPPSAAQELGLTWARSSASATPAALAYPITGLDAESLAAADLNNDGRSELLMFLRSGQIAPAGTVVAFELPPGRDQPNLLGRESAALDGARTIEQVRARLPLSRGLTPADLADATTTSVIGRMAYATQAQMGALVAPRFERCTVTYQRPGGRSTRSCRVINIARVPAARFAQDVTALFEHALEPLGIMTWECETAPREQCTAGRAGGFSTDFVFDGAGPQRRLRSVTDTDHGLGE